MQVIQKSLNILIIGLLIILGISFFAKRTLPDASQILPALKNEPIQSKVTKNPLTLDYKNQSYQVTPVYDYELWGLVVSHNNINAFWDYYHNSDSVDLKDICVIWGDNIKTNDFQKVEYKSGSWTCYFRYKAGVSFNHTQLSNNHLLSQSEAVQKAIRDLRVGDQVHLKGNLVNYSPVNNLNWIRESSTTRDDTGNNACEVVLVDQIDVLQRQNELWYTLFGLSWKVLIMAIGIKIMLFLVGLTRPLKSSTP